MYKRLTERIENSDKYMLKIPDMSEEISDIEVKFNAYDKLGRLEDLEEQLIAHTGMDLREWVKHTTSLFDVKKEIDDFEADCEWSEALQGEPGEFIAVVRKAKGKYFLGATTNKEARTLEIPLNFLEEGKKYQAKIYADGEDADWETNPTSYRIEEKIVTNADVLKVVMAKGGGQAISFLPIE